VQATDDPDSFLTVAFHLLAPKPDDPSWNACENARSRSAVSRSYYAGFIALKVRVEPHLRKLGREFPQADAHRRVKDALKRAGHARLSAQFEELRRARESADYAWGDRWREAAAEDGLRKGKSAVAKVAALSNDGIRAVAKHL
jgi:hypothetical protein